MFKAHSIKSYSLYSLLAAVIYGTLVGIFIKDYSYDKIYLIFIGNLLFGICIAIFLWQLHNKFNHTKSIPYLIEAGFITTGIGILFSAVITILLLAVSAPELFNPSSVNEKIAHAPVALKGNYSIITVLLFSLIVANLFAGGFISVLFSSTIKRITNNRT